MDQVTIELLRVVASGAMSQLGADAVSALRSLLLRSRHQQGSETEPDPLAGRGVVELDAPLQDRSDVQRAEELAEVLRNRAATSPSFEAALTEWGRVTNSLDSSTGTGRWQQADTVIIVTSGEVHVHNR